MSKSSTLAVKATSRRREAQRKMFSSLRSRWTSPRPGPIHAGKRRVARRARREGVGPSARCRGCSGPLATPPPSRGASTSAQPKRSRRAPPRPSHAARTAPAPAARCARRRRELLKGEELGDYIERVRPTRDTSRRGRPLSGARQPPALRPATAKSRPPHPPPPDTAPPSCEPSPTTLAYSPSSEATAPSRFSWVTERSGSR